MTRCANIYGGGDLNYTRIIPDAIRSLIRGHDPVIRSDGTPIRDYMYARDAADAYLTVAEHLDRDDVAGEAFNFGTETPISVLELVNEIIGVSGRGDLRARVAAWASWPARSTRSTCPARRRASVSAGAAIRPAIRLRQTYEWFSRFLTAEVSVPPRVLASA